MRSFVLTTIPFLALGLTVAGWPTVAEACGGFFCNTTPVDQTGEHILFVMDGDEIESHVLVQYAGPSESFAWIVPTPNLPVVGTSTAALFSRLTQQIGPQFFLNWSELGACDYGWGMDGDTVFAGAADGAPNSREGGGVTVVSQDQTGPYDFAILRATSVEALFGWLRDNGYDIPNEAMPFVDPYVQMGGDVHFVAFKLASNFDAGDITPITLRYRSDRPMIPIQLTAIASQPDMGVTVNILSDIRSVPDNYLHVKINEARIDWLRFGANYDELVTQAMNEAGGQAFTTEFAGKSSVMAGQLWTAGQYDIARLASITDPLEFFTELRAQGFPADSTLMGLLQQYIPMPDAVRDMGVTDQGFYNCLSCYEEFIDASTFDGAAFAAAIDEAIVEPLRYAQGLFDRIPYLTRLYTTLSAEEMTIDPMFTFNSSLGDVHNVHEADAIIDCRGTNTNYYDSPIIIRLEDGREIVTGWDDDRSDLDAMPAAERIEETSGSGGATLILNNKPAIDATLGKRAGRRIDDRGCYGGCNAGSSKSTGLLAIGMLLGFLAVRRRR